MRLIAAVLARVSEDHDEPLSGGQPWVKVAVERAIDRAISVLVDLGESYEPDQEEWRRLATIALVGSEKDRDFEQEYEGGFRFISKKGSSRRTPTTSRRSGIAGSSRNKRNETP